MKGCVPGHLKVLFRSAPSSVEAGVGAGLDWWICGVCHHGLSSLCDLQTHGLKAAQASPFDGRQQHLGEL